MALPKQSQNYSRGSANENRAPQQKPRLISNNIQTKPTISDDFAATQRQRLTGEQLLNREGTKRERRRQKKMEEITQNPTKLTNIANKQSGIKGSAAILRKGKVLRATWIAAGLCLGFFYYQAIFWIISMSGLGIEVISELGTEDTGMLGKLTVWLVDFLIPADSIFIAGYIVYAAIGFIQFLIAAAIYIGHGINPIKGTAFIVLIFSLTFSLMPFLGILPWAYVWMYSVFRTNMQNN